MKPKIIIMIIRAVIQTVVSASLKQGIPNFILLALSEEQSQLVATERQCFPYQTIKVKKKKKQGKKKTRTGKHKIAVKRDEQTNQDSERKKSSSITNKITVQKHTVTHETVREAL